MDIKSKRLDDVRVAITGGTSGLGLALVGELHRRGARVAFVARTAERVDQIARAHPGAAGIVGDISRKDDIYPMALQITAGLGGVDVLVNNASSLGPVPLALVADTDCEALELALATNLLGPFRLTKALLGGLAASARERRGGVIVKRRHRQHLERCGGERLSAVGGVRRQQGGAAASQPDLG
jgi:NAD(P)-dependent dehydrogenase (short-subunit alcohol dehydrogenase family)